MSLVPVDKKTGLKRPVNEQDRGALRKAAERAAWNRRNPDSKWKR